ncbi:hypothetical protein SAMD00023353_0801800 [Rosellinia necatrix]|uniref:BZIP domain-containing protein n=1 Tax=Rosellinia necatrix TaxID=77044 RepID=A0A1W2TB41_ROSNE|nr:hypothetical protein SAMD00023353_0801800 [Rosellinia necatrix]
MVQPTSDPVHPNGQLVPWSLEDDWRGIASARERRRIQNRINQRARRSRRRNEARALADTASPQGNVIRGTSPRTLALARIDSERPLDVRRVLEAINIFDPQSRETKSLIRAFEAFIYNNWLAGAPRPALLPSIIEFNFARALIMNAIVLDLTSSLHDDDALSNFNRLGPWPSGSKNGVASTLPAGLQPTELQCRTLHHPWIDLLPIPQMRDNLFRRGVDCFDEEGLCCAMRGRRGNSSAGFLIWKDPWDPHGWEVTEAFARSPWGWTIVGCWQLCRSTNKWREQRGEPPLFYNVPQDDVVSSGERSINSDRVL